MRLLLSPSREPDQTPVSGVYADILDRVGDPAFDREMPYLLLNMVASADGAISVNGLSAGLSGSEDKAVFFYLRSLADVILVGASTARAENYGPVRLSEDLLAARAMRGRHEMPRIALVTRSLQIDWSARLFSPEGPRPYIICPASAPADRRAAAAEVADVLIAGETDVDLAAALRKLAARGSQVVLCEGGPTLNGQLLAAGLVDELCLTMSPVLVGGSGPRITGWAAAHEPLALELLAVAEASGVLLLRYAVGPGKSALHE